FVLRGGDGRQAGSRVSLIEIVGGGIPVRGNDIDTDRSFGSVAGPAPDAPPLPPSAIHDEATPLAAFIVHQRCINSRRRILPCASRMRLCGATRSATHHERVGCRGRRGARGL